MKTILYIDDDLNSLLLIKEQLKLIDNSIKLITESRGNKSIETFKKYNGEIDLVILDVYIPDIDGYDLLFTFKKINPNIPIILITASTGNREYDYVIKKLGAEEYIIKPVGKELLTDITNIYLKGL